MSKYKVGDHVRVTAPMATHFDEVGAVVAITEHSLWPVKVKMIKEMPYSQTLLYKESALTRADPDVHTVLDEMDAESRPHKDMAEMEIDGEYVRGREVRSVSSTGAEKGTKAERFDLLPVEALATVARHYAVGAEKYSAHNWRKGYEWSKSYAALQRHAHLFWSGQDNDDETGTPHMAAVAFHALSLLTFMDEQPAFDDRYRTEAAL